MNQVPKGVVGIMAKRRQREVCVGAFKEEFQKVSWNRALKGKKRARGRPGISTK